MTDTDTPIAPAPWTPPQTTEPTEQPKPRGRARRVLTSRWFLVPSAFVLGAAIMSGGSGETTTATSTTTDEQVASLQRQVDAVEAQRDQAMSDRDSFRSERDELLSAQQDQQEAAAEEKAQSTITEGTWTVGLDIEPGRYRTAEAVTGDCYWGIYRTGTNGEDIIANDIVTGGRPTVTLKKGQDFTNRGCGDFVRVKG